MATIRKKAALMIASLFYVGLFPGAPGTMGSLAALPLAWFLWMLDFHLAWGVVIATFLLGVFVSSLVIGRGGKEDDQRIVIDEAVGIFVTASVAEHIWWQYLLVFLVFRVFDIFKPGPIGWIDARVKGGFGAMLDDLVAALLSAFVLYMILWLTQLLAGPALA